MEHWYAVFTKPRREAVAEEHLARQGFEVWLPRACQTRRRAGRWSEHIEPLFPRYLFLHADPERENLAPIRATRGVTGLVRTGVEPTVVADAVIEGLRALEDTENRLCRIENGRLSPGDTVEILHGPFEGMRGLLKARNGAERVIVLLDILGQESRVTLSRHQVSGVRSP
jgi:transcriptional antiterminator RfaH